ncbi:MAG: hypothetical protein CMI04_00535 [Oceanospirillaceae bacterium]|nr:hypothetical protein [Oceanospirillaceae bacterium]
MSTKSYQFRTQKFGIFIFRNCFEQLLFTKYFIFFERKNVLFVKTSDQEKTIIYSEKRFFKGIALLLK